MAIDRSTLSNNVQAQPDGSPCGAGNIFVSCLLTETATITSHSVHTMLKNASVLWIIMAALLSLVWKLFKRIILKSPLDRIPGPGSVSFAKGSPIVRTYFMGSLTGSLGNMEQINERNAWSFLDHLSDDYQPIVKLNGLFGVRLCAHFTDNNS